MNCSRCGWLLEEADQKCPACGLAREQPQTRGPGRTLPLVPAVAAVAAVAGAYYLGVHRAAVSRNAGPADAPAQAAPALRLIVAQSSAAVSASIAVSSAPEAAAPGIARLPPVPQPTPNRQTIYGVAYDLATLAPVAGAAIEFRIQANPNPVVRTDENGWYRIELPPGQLERSVEVAVAKDGYQATWQERDPPIASLSPGRRRAIPEENRRKGVMIKLWAGAPLAELDLVLEPMRWPNGFAAPVYAPAEDPAPPEPAGGGACRLYGVAYDLATKIPMRAVEFGFRDREEPDSRPYMNFKTDGKGHYNVVLSADQIERGVDVVPIRPLPSYVSGVAADQQPSLRDETDARRKSLAGEIEIGSAPVPDDCLDGFQLLDLVFVPKKWP